jgi:hypothetical protein
MATSTNSKVFVSPGVYTSEVDLSFVAQSVGVTTLGIVGETLKGPAFEPIFIRNFDEFSTYFGGTSPEKFVNTQIPKYEASYIAKSYLQQSNQLFVTRVLGLSGYDAGPSWSITTKANVDPTTIQYVCLSAVTANCVSDCVTYKEIDFTVSFTGCTNGTTSITYTDTTELPDAILAKLNLPFEQFNGDISSLDAEMKTQIFNVMTTPSTSDSSVYYYGAVPGDYYSANTNNGYTARTDVFEVSNMNSDLINYSDPLNDAWYYAMFDNIGGGQYTGSSFYTYITDLTLLSSNSNCSSFYNYNVNGHVSSGGISSGGTGYSVLSETGVSTVAQTGYGAGLTLNIRTNGSAVTAATINQIGTGYEVGDIVYIDSGNSDAYFTISAITSSTGSINYNTKTINVYVPNTVDLTQVVSSFSACTTDVTVSSTNQSSDITVNDFSSGCLTYTLVSEDGSVTNNFSVCVMSENVCNPSTPGNVGSITTGTIVNCYSGVINGTYIEYEGESYKDFDDLVIATLRSRGLATYSSDDGVVYEVSGLTNVSLNTSGIYSGVTKNPYSTFTVNATGRTGTNYSFETSFSNSDSRYLTKVFGMNNFGKDKVSVPLFVEERFQALLNYGWRKGYIRGLSSDLISLPDARQGSDPSSIGFYLEKYQSPESSWVVSELRGNKVYNLFKFTTISDGYAANLEVKISIANISFGNGTFDVLVRDYFDTDSAPQVIEKFTNCSMDPNQNNFIAKKIGSADGEYQLNSKYIMVEVNEEAPTDALPCGFDGYNTRTYNGGRSPFPIFKTKYDFPGEVIYNPPFGLASGADDLIRTAGDNVRRTYLGFSDTVGYDVDFVNYKGKQLPLDICTAISGNIWDTKTRGFHMDNRASGITINNTFYEKVFDVEENIYVMSAITVETPKFYTGSDNFSSDPTNESNPYYRLYARKFTMVVAGGFDGWDIYRESRTNLDRFVLGRSGYLKGSCPSVKYPTATGWGAFKQITVGDNTQDWGNTDYYAYLLGQRSFANPEAVNINVFATPGIDYNNNSDLVESAIDMVENDRADSIYICTTADFNMFTPTANPDDLIYPQEAVDILEGSGIDSNYTATYYPWVLTRDSVNNTQIYLPPTAEVTRNLALTDNIAFPWFAAAGYTRGIVNAVKARKKLTQEDRDVLYKGRINPIATFSDVGTVIWGNKTLQIRESALDRINVRRLLLQARKLISAVSVRLLFEQNDQKVRQDFLNAVNPILDSIRRDRGLYDFRVSVSSDAADLDRNQMTGKIYIKPTKSLEFIDITFYITPTGASFENI